MQIRIIFLAVCFFLISACSKGPAGEASSTPSAPAAAASVSAFPATLEGNLAIGVSNDWGYFGDLTVAGNEYPLAIPGAIFEASGVPNEGGKVRVTIESKQTDPVQYMVSSIAKQ